MITLEKIQYAKRKLECAKSVLTIINNDYDNPNGSVSEYERKNALECVTNSLDQLNKEVDDFIQTKVVD